MPTAAKDIVINITDKARGQKIRSFTFLVIGEKFPFFRLRIQAGISGINWISKVRESVFVNVLYVDPSAADQSLSVVRTGTGTGGDPFIITVNLATDAGSNLISTAAQIKAAAEADGDTNSIVSVKLVQNPGNGVVTAESSSALVAVGDRFNTFGSPEDLTAFGYEQTDDEFIMVAEIYKKKNPAEVLVFSADSTTSGPANYTTELSALVAVPADNKWTFLLSNRTTKADVQEMGNFAANNGKISIGLTDDLTAFVGRNLDSEVYIITDDVTKRADAFWASEQFTPAAGRVDGKWVEMTGFTAPDFSFSQLTAIRDGNANTIVEDGGIFYMNENLSTSGKFIDIKYGSLQVETRTREAIVLKLIQEDKVGFDDIGFGELETVIRRVFKGQGQLGVIARVVSEIDGTFSDEGEFQFQIFFPTFAEQSPTSKGNRTITDPPIKFKYVPRGGVHELAIEGEITFE